uniref:WD and tetratricopeptide repeats protein 1 n=1 Tax=Sipha flava TaxID=143950 RepID=A0A2S2QA93_9HEMI
MSFETKRRNILQLMRDRELNDHIKTKYALKNNLNNKCISKLGLLTNLNGHQGCVNCLQWNGSGSTLASASDDFQVILWDPFAHKIKTSIKTLHRGNIFTVKFLPNCNDDVVATGAADWNSHTYNLTTGKRLSICTCAEGRVKRIAVANDTPSVFWSASEDGIIRQHDMRMNHECSSDHNKIGILSIYNYEGERIEAKCLDINQLRTEQLAVGANDPYVRLYDRRMVPSLSLIPNHKAFPELYSGLVFNSNSDLNRSKKAKRTLDDVVQYFVPGHIHPDRPELPPNKNKNIGITYLTFSPDGQELLVNYGSEYVYLYDLSKQVQDAFSNVPKVMKVYRKFFQDIALKFKKCCEKMFWFKEKMEKELLKTHYSIQFRLHILSYH